ALPTPKEEPVFAQNESLYRLLVKATRTNPDERFQTADEMASQLIGVLRETVAATGTPRPVESTQFSGDNAEGLDDPDALDIRALPVPKPDPLDPAAGTILAAASLTDPDQVAAQFEQAMARFPESVEAPLLLARARIEQGRYDDAEKLLKDAQANDPFDWQVTWLRALSAFAQGEHKKAFAGFDAVYSEVPGELAPKVALAFAAESTGDYAAAATLYDRVSRTDPAFTSAAFGLARCRTKAKDRAGAVAAYGRIPATSRRYTLAQVALARVLVRPELAPPGASELAQASVTVQALAMEGYALHQLSVELLRAAIRQVEARAIAPGSADKVLGQPLEATPLRLAVGRELRACARFAKTREEQIALVDAANTERPRTLL
ncbi:MAG: tetratricopeptide repeat protein, partial [Armatimonadetes bacterium]|nr:tetratricopeptide repeat protein [Armatimonadota bacterium]